ncbi:HEAT repeat domain-containing protein [Tengunoibacter tsumagoiensis]|uniref:HEAT repeat domain-containing protein n=1 Tax=Tengunoibacter tsumagoiensis TaxID=2014871 RepID=A0A402A407_9CHLR|nr:HEAT repeat domain-containing protein [Tengunoibacter tsumagoiensis]GCE13884.1 hypothetical protein KTT_37430 [Tengunoibacter tsumagoiensis]
MTWDDDEDKELAQKLTDLQQGKIRDEDLYHTIWTLGKAEYWPAKPTIEQYLDYTGDEDVRVAAMMVLTNRFGAKDRKYWEMARDILANPDSYHRSEAITVLTIMKNNTHDLETLQLLAAIVNNPKEASLIRTFAYAAMHQIIRFDPLKSKQITDDPFDIDRDTDWEFVHRYI